MCRLIQLWQTVCCSCLWVPSLITGRHTHAAAIARYGILEMCWCPPAFLFLFIVWSNTKANNFFF